MSEQHADLLQFQLREECLKLGAALFYCSGTVQLTLHHRDPISILPMPPAKRQFSLPWKSQGTTDRRNIESIHIEQSIWNRI